MQIRAVMNETNSTKGVRGGHRDQKSLETYQGLSLADLSDDYQKAMNDFPVK
jgi:hypothetical protein